MGEEKRRFLAALKGEKLPGEIMAEMVLSDQARAEACLSEIESVLKKHDCYADPVFIFDNQGGRGMLQIKPNQRLVKP